MGGKPSSLASPEPVKKDGLAAAAPASKHAPNHAMEAFLATVFHSQCNWPSFSAKEMHALFSGAVASKQNERLIQKVSGLLLGPRALVTISRAEDALQLRFPSPIRAIS